MRDGAGEYVLAIVCTAIAIGCVLSCIAIFIEVVK